MRSTRASAAVARLNRRVGDQRYVLVVTGNGLFKLREETAGTTADVGEALELDAFVRFVDAQSPPAPKPRSKFDDALARQLTKKS